MKNRTLVRFFAIFLAVMMTMGMFALCASAEKKTVYDEENCIVEYEDGVVTVKLNAEKLAEVIASREFSKATLKEILPEGIYRVIDERSKAAVVAFLLNLADKGVFDYDEMINAFAGDEAVMKKYVNLELFASFFKKPVVMEELKAQYAAGTMDAFFEKAFGTDTVRAYLYDKLGVTTDLDTLNDFDAFLDAVKDAEAYFGVDENKELQALFPTRELVDVFSMREAIKKAGGSVINKKMRGFLTQVLFGEVDVMYVNGTPVYSDYLFDHNALQTAILQALPSVSELAAISDGDTVAEYAITTTGPNIAMTFGLKIELFGDTTGINKNAARLDKFFSYAVQDDGLITADVYLDERFVENYTKVLESDALSTESKIYYLSLYTADGAALQAQFSGAKFDEFLTDAKNAGVKFSDKIDPNRSLINKIAKLMVKIGQYDTAFTTLDDTYQGDGVFVIHVKDEIPFDYIADQLHSRYSSIDEVLDWLKHDDHIIDTEVTFTVENFYRVRFFDENNNQLYVTYLPVGTKIYDEDATIISAIPELSAYGPVWYDKDGNPVNAVPQGDIDLYPETEGTNLNIIKVWDDDNNRDGVRPGSLNFNVIGNGQVVSTVSVVPAEDKATRAVAEEDVPVGTIPEEETEVIYATVDGNNWYFTITNLPTSQDGAAIRYTVQETEEVPGYTSYTEYTDNGIIITNTHEPETVTITGSKVWNDPTTKDQKRPESITVILYANGVEVDRIEVDGEGDVWDFAFEPQYKYENGEEIVYTIDEVDIAGYNKVINGYEIINSGVLGVSLFVLISMAAAGGVFAAVKVAKKRKDQE